MQALAQRLAQAPERTRPDRPVPIALVITDLDVGGAERALVALATGLDSRWWEPSVVCLGSEGRLVEPLRSAGIETRCLGVKRRRPLQAVLRLAAALEARSPELVQSFLFHANIAARLAARLVGVPWVLGGLRVAERQKGWHLSVDRLTAWLSAGSVCVSEGVLRFSREVGRLPADRLTVIANGVDLAPFDRAEPLGRESIGVPASAHLVLFIGRIDVQKGLSTMLDAAERVAAARPEWHLAVVGDGPLRDKFKQRTASSPFLRERVHWLGQRDDIPALLQAADLLVLPSLWEGMPNVVLEAMAAGRAVVASRIEGTEDLVLPGQTGWLVPAGAPHALAEALLVAAADPDLTHRFGAAGRARAEAFFTLDRMIAAYDHLWSRILGLKHEEIIAPAGTPDTEKSRLINN